MAKAKTKKTAVPKTRADRVKKTLEDVAFAGVGVALFVGEKAQALTQDAGKFAKKMVSKGRKQEPAIRKTFDTLTKKAVSFSKPITVKVPAGKKRAKKTAKKATPKARTRKTRTSVITG